MKQIQMMFLTAGLIGTLATGLPGRALCESGGVERPCKADAEKFCKDVKPGERQVRHCLKENLESLSPECRERIEKAKEKMKEVHEACREDKEKFCKDVKPGEGRVRQCLKEHESELSEGCRKAKDEHHPQK